MIINITSFDNYYLETIRGMESQNESATSVHTHIALVESAIEKAGESLLEYKYSIEELRQQLHGLHARAAIESQDIESCLCPQMEVIEKNLRSVVEQQKDGNAKF